MSDATKTLTAGNVDHVIAKATKPVVIKFWAAWCAPCKALAPHVDAMATDQELSDQFEFYSCDTDANMGVGGRFRVTALPTVLVVEPRTGDSLAEFRGAVPPRKLREALEDLALVAAR